MELRAVESSTTNPHVRVVDIDLSYRERWWNAIENGLQSLSSHLDGKTKKCYIRYVNRGVDGWSAPHGCGHDGILLLRVRRRLWWRQGKIILRITGVKLGFNNEQEPSAIACLLYETEMTEPVRDMLAAIGRELGVRHDLTVYRTPVRSRWEGLFWLKHL